MPSPLDVDALRSAFPVADAWIYLNHAAVAPLPSPVAAAVREFLDDAEHQGSTGWRGWIERKETARTKAARLLGGHPDEVAVTTSTSHGLTLVAEGIAWEPGDEILVVQDDFPANLMPWYRQERRGAHVVVAPRPDGRLALSDLLDRISPRTRVVAVPWVLYDTGQRLDLATLGRALTDHRAWLCVDAIQGLGAFPLDVRAAGIDALSADSHKWMLGLEGVGVFWCAQERLAELDPPLVSWLSLEEPFTPYRPGKALRGDARRFEWASPPTAGVFGLDACLDLLLTADPAAMAPRVLSLSKQLADGLTDAGWRVMCAGSPDAERSGIVTARPPRLGADAAVEALTERRVSVTPRGGGVRFAPHAWNTEAEIDRALELLP